MCPENNTEKESNWFIVVLMILAAGILLLGGTFINWFRSSGQSINTAKLGLDDMKDISVNKINGIKDSLGHMTYQPDSYAELQKTLGIHLLDGTSVNHGRAKIEGVTDNTDYHRIEMMPFVETDEYSLNMTISIKCSADQTQEGLMPEFLGEFELKGDFISLQGYHVVVIGGITETLPDGSISSGGSLTAVFVADGILYQLSGKVDIGELKRMINSLS